MACAHWLSPGRWEVDNEPTGAGIEGLPPHPPQPWVSAPGTGNFFTELCRVPPSRGRLLHHQGTRAALGHPAYEGSTFDLGLAFGYGPTLRPLAQCQRASHRDSTRRLFSRIVTGASLLTSIATRRSRSSFAEPNNSLLLRGSAPAPIQLFSVCLVATGMRVNEAVSLDSSRMLTSTSESFTSGGRSLENHATCRFIRLR